MKRLQNQLEAKETTLNEMQQKLEHEGEELERVRRMNQDLQWRQANELSRLIKEQNARESGDSAKAAKVF